METESRRSLRARENHGGSEVTEIEDLDEAMGNTDGSASEESEGDPTYDVLEETRLSLSKISIKKSRKRFSEEKEPDSDGELESMDLEVPELNQKEKKCFEKVEMIIRDGQLEKLKVDECKVYLRKYGLRLIGNKDVLIARIREHLEVMDGGGEKRYPISSFVFDCKGDACTGDVVMFEQNVYDMYSIASRSATGPPCGTRTVVGRIVKESYGAAKQQHTFTIEVLWSKGEKPLPPMHPLLIKGRNLYRIKTMRQKWDDEVERKKTLQEKHSRGFVARCSREKRIEVKEMRKTNHMKRLHEKEGNKKIPTTQTCPVDSIGIPSRQGVQNQLDPTGSNALTQNRIQNQIDHTKPNSLAHLCHQYQATTAPHKPIDHFGRESQAQININKSQQQMDVPRSPQAHRVIGRSKLKPQLQSSLHHFPQLHNQRHTVTDWAPKSPSRSEQWRSPSMEMYYDHHMRPLLNTSHLSLHGAPSQLRREEHHHRQPLSNLNYTSSRGAPPLQQRLPTYQQFCRYYPLGRCYYGDNCKYLHSER